MPELPEVETVVRGLQRLRGHCFVRVGIHAPRLRHALRPRDFTPVVGERIVAVRRRAKYIIIECANRAALVCHLGMTGSFRFTDCADTRDKHDHLDWQLADGRCLRYNDPRRFGSAVVVRLAQPGADPEILAHLGPEPLGTKFTAGYLFAATRGRTAAIKPCIMDQRIVVGVGNIYASEALHRAGIRPSRRAGRVSRAESARLVAEIRRVLRMAIRAGGTTISDYRDADGSEGKFDVRLRVYGRAGETCSACGDRIRQLVLGGRSSFYCPSCQR